MTGVLMLCTANICRSAMALPLLSARLDALGAPGVVRSAGITGMDGPPPPGAVAALAARGHDITGHRGRTAQVADLDGADLVLGMAREHVRHVVAVAPEAWPRTFTLKELVRRGRLVGPRVPGEPLAAWLDRAGHGRDHRDLLGRSAEDDVADPYGGPAGQFELTAALLDQLTRELADLGWGLTGES
jgi:protein-tyrosine phosphatase